jgi:hypothetical protein
MGCPPTQYEWERAVSGDPFPVVFSGNMDMPAGGVPSFAGRMADEITRFYPGTQLDAVFTGDVQVHNCPASLFVSIAIQVDDNYAVS